MRGFLSLTTIFLLSMIQDQFTDVHGKTSSDQPIIYVNGKTVDLDPTVQHIPLDPLDQTLRPPPAKVPSSFEIFIGSSVFRDGFRCGKTIFTAFKRATYPERLRFGILEQLVAGDPTCLEEYCKRAVVEWPDHGECRYHERVQITPRPAAESAGCTTARHQQQKMIQDEEFCLQVDGHSIFTNGWDENLLTEWKRIDNEMAILSVYPHDIHDFVLENGDNNSPDWLPHLCRIVKGGNGMARINGANVKKHTKVPQMAALWGGGLSFSKCHAEKNVPVDPHTPWLWDGEEFLRSADYWTHGYDIYSPSKFGNVLYHNYSKKPTPSFWNSPIDPEKKNRDTEMSRNRFRLRVGLPFKGLVDALELDEYGFGEARTFKEYLQFANVSFEGWFNDTNSCGQLHWVPYSNASVVEEIVGDGWKMRPTELTVPTPIQQMLTAQNGYQEVENDVPKQQEIFEDDVDDQVQRNLEVHVKNGAAVGEDKPDMEIAQLRHDTIRPKKQKPINVPAWGLLVVVAAALFVTLSNDSKSRAIRQSCVSNAPHLSYE